jgi:hypothetical protein
VSAAFSRHWRLQVEVAQRRSEAPEALLADGTVVRLQLGSKFAEAVH